MTATKAPLNVIALIRATGCWAAKYISGPEADKVNTAFDSNTLPLPFTEDAEVQQVRQHVERMYRDNDAATLVFELTGEYQRVCNDAILIYSGACNPLGVSKAFAEACTACYRATGSMDKSLAYAPARLIHAQLGHLLGVGYGDYLDNAGGYTPDADDKFCRAIID